MVEAGPETCGSINLAVVRTMLAERIATQDPKWSVRILGHIYFCPGKSDMFALAERGGVFFGVSWSGRSRGRSRLSASLSAYLLSYTMRVMLEPPAVHSTASGTNFAILLYLRAEAMIEIIKSWLFHRLDDVLYSHCLFPSHSHRRSSRISTVTAAS